MSFFVIFSTIWQIYFLFSSCPEFFGEPADPLSEVCAWMSVSLREGVTLSALGGGINFKVNGEQTLTFPAVILKFLFFPPLQGSSSSSLLWNRDLQVSRKVLSLELDPRRRETWDGQPKSQVSRWTLSFRCGSGVVWDSRIGPGARWCGGALSSGLQADQDVGVWDGPVCCCVVCLWSCSAQVTPPPPSKTWGSRSDWTSSKHHCSSSLESPGLLGSSVFGWNSILAWSDRIIGSVLIWTLICRIPVLS